jgi:ABC-type Na+ efflux pump permease subunit
VCGSLLLVGTGLFVMTDVDGLARSLRSGTRPWSLLRPGALRGLRFMLGLFLVWTLFCVFLHQSSRSPESNARALLLAIVAAPAYSVLFLSLALVVGRLPRSNRLSSPVAVRVLFFILVGLFSTLPPLFSLLMDLQASDGLMNILNPVVGTANFGTHERLGTGDKMTAELLGFVVVVAVLAAFAADRALAEREKRAHAS